MVQTHRTAAVIGTGFSGICAAIRLQKEFGIKAQLFEMSGDVGGTWYHNRYPGAECDIPSHLYSLSFELNPSWTRHYSGQAEIQAYLRGVAEKYNLIEQILFKTEVVKAEWIENRQQWYLEWRSVENQADIYSSYFDFVFAGLGPLRIPNIPKEFTSFSGTMVHTTQWDPTIDFTGKRVAVIGSGSTAIQLLPELQKVAGHLYSYQRTPAWVTPRDQFMYPWIIKFLFKYIPFLMRFYRFLIYLQHESYYPNFGYYGSWISRMAQRAVEKTIALRLKRAGRPDLIPKLTPKYPFGCKRITKSEIYLEAMAKPNVSLITCGISEVKGRTIVDNDGNETEIDILVLATGFDIQGFTGNLKILGRNGRSLKEEWKTSYPKSYKTVNYHGYPNFYLLLGPSSGLGHNSVVIIAEIQVNFAINCIKRILKKDLAALEPKASAQTEFVKKLQSSFAGTVWKGGCKSWYLNEQGEAYALWSSTVSKFWWMMRNPVFDNYIEHKKAIKI